MTISIDASRAAAPIAEPEVAPTAPTTPSRAPDLDVARSAVTPYGQRAGHAGETKGPAQLPQAVAKAFEAPVSPEQKRFERLLRTDTKLFVNPTKSAVNCSECSIALDQRLAGDMEAVARDEAIAQHGLDPVNGMLLELERPEVIAALVDVDDRVEGLARLRRGEVTLTELREAALPKLHRAIDALLAADFSGDTSRAEAAVAEVTSSPHVVLMNRHNEADYSITEVARRLGHPVESIESFASKESSLWSRLPLFEAPGFNTKKLVPVARRSGVADALRKRVRSMETNQRAVLSFLAVAPDGTVHSHILNVVKPNSTFPMPGGGTRTMGPNAFVVDGQLGHVYDLDAFVKYTYPNLLSADLLVTGDEVHNGKNNALYYTLLQGVAATHNVLKWANW